MQNRADFSSQLRVFVVQNAENCFKASFDGIVLPFSQQLNVQNSPPERESALFGKVSAAAGLP
ncbi:MAG: hypothetical protein KKD01_13845 [Proteobacteria bacterium]|nr:hypothetical protein [Pseudomonadota bacterium]MBU1420095.1 hypothetical protein [Pseudomonadota bacterium]MBU1455803.1 hypothetical protein [Pseudomonadota bacterium]